MWSHLCVVIMCTMFHLYIINLKATVTLTFIRLISKSSTLQYKCLCQVWGTLVNSVSTYHLGKVWSICQYVDGHSNLDHSLIDLKFYRDHLHPKTHVYAKFDKPRSILCLVIIRTRFGLYVNMLKVTVTLTFDQLTSKSIGIIYTPRCMSVPNLRHLGQFRV